jgi:hypothetical protein
LRKHQRKSYSKSILLLSRNRFYKGLTQNLSSSGAYIKIDCKFEAGEKIAFAIPLKKGGYAHINGEVMWSKQDGFGMKFLKIRK